MKKLLFISTILCISIPSARGSTSTNEEEKLGPKYFKDVLSKANKKSNPSHAERKYKLKPLPKTRGGTTTLNDIVDPDKMVISKRQLEEHLKEQNEEENKRRNEYHDKLDRKLDDLLGQVEQTIVLANSVKVSNTKEEEKKPDQNENTQRIIPSKGNSSSIYSPFSKKITTLSLVYKYRKRILMSLFAFGVCLYFVYTKFFQKPPNTVPICEREANRSNADIEADPTINTDFVPNWIKYLFSPFGYLYYHG